jgi:hypothetical protein
VIVSGSAAATEKFFNTERDKWRAAIKNRRYSGGIAFPQRGDPKPASGLLDRPEE